MSIPENKTLYKRKTVKHRLELWGNNSNTFRIIRSGYIYKEGPWNYIKAEWFLLTGDELEEGLKCAK